MRISDWSSDVCSSDLVRAWVKISTVFPARADTPDRRRFEAAVADMPEEMRQIFLAHALDGLPYETIAEQLLVGVAEVQLQVGMALARLDEAVAHDGGQYTRTGKRRGGNECVRT